MRVSELSVFSVTVTVVKPKKKSGAVVRSVRVLARKRNVPAVRT